MTVAAIDWRDFGKQYPRRKEWAVHETTLTVPRGSVFGIFGRNGSGKSTLMRAAAGLIRPTIGSVHVEGRQVTRASLATGQGVGYMPQRALSLNSLRVGESVRAFSAINDLTSANQSLRDSIIDELHLSELWNTPVRDLSGGQAKLVQFAVAFCTNSNVIILDEPTNELDTINRRKLWGMITSANKVGKTIAVVSHNIIEAANSVTDIAIVHQGQVATFGSAQEVIQEASGLLTIRYTSPDSRERYNITDEIELAKVAETVAELIKRGVIDIDIGPPQLEDIFLRVVGGE